MKSQKRDIHQRAFKRGYDAGIKGRPKDICPLHQNDVKQDWLAGWREGRQDFWDGLTGINNIARSDLMS